MDRSIINDATRLWDYMKLNHVVQKSDLILCLCSYDVCVADRATELWHQGTAYLMVFSGKSGSLTDDRVYMSRLFNNKSCIYSCRYESDLILCLCSYDIRVADKAAELWHQGMADIVVFSGKSGKLTEGIWTKPEAEVFKDRAIELGVPDENILVENNSTNTGENVRFSFEMLKERNILPSSVIIVQKPYMERRAYATFMKQWSGNIDHVTVSVTSPEIGLLDYPNDVVGDLEYTINILVGDFARIRLYEEQGFQIKQDIPSSVQQAFDRLMSTGRFNKHLPMGLKQ